MSETSTRTTAQRFVTDLGTWPLWKRGALAAVAAVVVDLVVLQALVAVVRPAPELLPLSLGAVAFFSFLGAVGATIAYAVVQRFAADAPGTYWKVATAVLLVSLLPNMLMLTGGDDPFPGMTPPAVLALMVLHGTAFGFIVPVLAGRPRLA